MPTSISPKGQVTIPSNIRKEWDIQPGDRFDFDMDWKTHGIIIYPLKNEKRKTKQYWIEAACGLLKGKGSVDEFLEEKQREIKKENT